MMKSVLTISAEEKTQSVSAKLALLFIICFAGNVFGGAVSTLMSVYLPVVVKEFQGNRTDSELNSISGYINSLFIFGWAVGGFLWGLISDKTGRKTALLLSVGSYGIFTMLTGLSQNWVEIMVCRFMSGFGVGGLLVISFTLISEAWPERSKAVFTGVLSISIPVGIFSAGLINYFVSSWRQGFFIGVLPLLTAIAGYWLIDESELWLRDCNEKSSKLRPAGNLFSGSNGKTLLVGSVIFGTMLIGLWAIFSWLPTWIQGLPNADVHKAGGISMMFLGMGGLTGGFLSGWLVNLIGLRKSLIACFAVCALLSFVLFKTNSSFSPVIYAEIAIIALFFGASQGILSLYIPQLFPTAIRGSATGFCFNIGRLFTAAAVLFVGVLVTALGGYSNSLFIFSLVFVIGLIAVLLFKNIQGEAGE
jgi:MFS family permease